MLTTAEVEHSYPRAAGPAVSIPNLVAQDGIVALVGANGAGKTTFLKCLSGGLKPTSGEIRLDGLNPYSRSDRRQALSKIALMPQFGSSPRLLTTHQFVSYLTWMRGVSRQEAADRAWDSLVAVGLGKRADDRMRSLSGGMVRRVWFAQALAAKAELMLLDEPSTGLDPRQRATMVDLIREHARGLVLLSSHLVEDVVALASRVIVLEQGHIVFDGAVGKHMDSSWLLSLIRSDVLSSFWTVFLVFLVVFVRP